MNSASIQTYIYSSIESSRLGRLSALSFAVRSVCPLALGIANGMDVLYLRIPSKTLGYISKRLSRTSFAESIIGVTAGENEFSSEPEDIDESNQHYFSVNEYGMSARERRATAIARYETQSQNVIPAKAKSSELAKPKEKIKYLHWRKTIDVKVFESSKRNKPQIKLQIYSETKQDVKDVPKQMLIAVTTKVFV